MRHILNDETRLTSLKVRYGLKVSKTPIVSAYIMQIGLEKQIKQYIKEYGGDIRENLIVEACSYIRAMSDDIVLEVTEKVNSGVGILEALFSHKGHKNTPLRNKLLEL